MPHRCHRTAQLEPVLLPDMTSGDGQEAAKPRLRGQGVVRPGVAATLTEVVADGEQLALLIEKERELRLLHESIDGPGQGLCARLIICRACRACRSVSGQLASAFRDHRSRRRQPE